MIRRYSELKRLETFKERFDYLKLNGKVGRETFGFDRWLNQLLYHRRNEWKEVRREVIIRDNGCDLGIEGEDIKDRIYVHHMNPITIQNVLDDDPDMFNPEYLICVRHSTHNGIHYGCWDHIPKPFTERRPGDTCPWKH